MHKNTQRILSLCFLVLLIMSFIVLYQVPYAKAANAISPEISDIPEETTSCIHVPQYKVTFHANVAEDIVNKIDEVQCSINCGTEDMPTIFLRKSCDWIFIISLPEGTHTIFSGYVVGDTLFQYPVEFKSFTVSATQDNDVYINVGNITTVNPSEPTETNTPTDIAVPDETSPSYRTTMPEPRNKGETSNAVVTYDIPENKVTFKNIIIYILCAVAGIAVISIIVLSIFKKRERF